MDSIMPFVGSILICLMSIFTSGCGGSGGDDTEKVPVVVPVPPQQPSVTQDNDTCPIIQDATEPADAVELVEAATGGEATDVEEIPGLDQGSALRTFRVWVKDIQVNVTGCDNHVSVTENHPDITSTTNPQVTQ